MKLHLKMFALVLALGLASGACEKNVDKDEPADDDGESKSKKKRKKKKKKSGGGGFEKGEEIAVQLKLAASDSGDLACARKGDADGLRCAFIKPGTDADVDERDPRKNDKILQPFTTLDGRKLLVAGVWSQPDVSAVIADSKDRFLATCKLMLVEESGKAKIRTFPSAPWSDVEDHWIARTQKCTVTESDKPKPTPVPTAQPVPSVASTRVYVAPSSYTPRIGPEHAKVTIMLFTDVQCPFCAKVAPTLQQVAKDNKTTVALHLRHFPLAFHKEAEPAARAIQAAEKLGKGWALHNLLSANAKSLGGSNIDKHALSLGLNMTKFKAAMSSTDIKKQVDDDVALGRSSSVRGTPTIMFNGEKHKGGRSLSDFQRVIDAEILRADALLAKGTPTDQLYKELCK